MKQAPAVVFVEPNRVNIWSMELPDLEPEDVGIRTIYSGISQGTERWTLTGRYNRMHENVSSFYPCSPGYQAAGIVDVLGEKVTGLAVGDHVFVQGTRFKDPTWKYPGPCLAAHAGYLVASRSLVVKLPPEVDLSGASLYHMAAVSLHGVRLVNIRQGDVVVIIGQGMIGQMSGQVARLRGARVITAEISKLRVELSARFSADRAVNVSIEDLGDAVREEAPDGADVVVDTTGSSRIIEQCINLVRREGRICLQGYYPDPIKFDFHATHLKRVTVTFPCGWDPEEITHLSEHMAANRIQITPLITHAIPFNQAADVYKLIMENPEDTLGIVFDWNISG